VDRNGQKRQSGMAARTLLAAFVFALALAFLVYALVDPSGAKDRGDSARGPESALPDGSPRPGAGEGGEVPGMPGPARGKDSGAPGPSARAPAVSPLRPGKIRPFTGPAPADSLRFPDGTWLPAVNGARGAGAFPGFSGGRPYAPVVEVIRDSTGLLWFKHADGSHSTVQLLEVERQGLPPSREPGWVVGNPTAALPLDLPGKQGLGPQTGKEKPKSGGKR